MLSQNRIITIPVSANQLSRPNRELSFVLELTNFLAGRLSLREVLDGALDKVQEQFSLETGRIYLMDEDGQGLTLEAHRGLKITGLEHVDLGEGFSGRSAQERSFIAQRVKDLDNAARARLLSSLGLISIVCLPLIAGDRVVGVMNLGAGHLIKLDMETIDLFTVLGNIIAVAVQNTRRAERLESQAREIQAQKESVEFLTYTVSHDLKSPAAAIGALAARLLRKYGEGLDPKGRETCEQIQKAAQSLDQLVRELNQYIQVRAKPMNFEPVDLDEVMGEVSAAVLAETETKRVDLKVASPLGQVTADRLSVSRALGNLVGNALKYGGPGLSRIEVSRQDSDGMVVLKVADNGVGLTTEQSGAIFELFSRGETSQGQEGTGLGLAIVRQAARRHGGEAWVDSQPGQGAAFYFSLAAEPPEPDDNGTY